MAIKNLLINVKKFYDNSLIYRFRINREMSKEYNSLLIPQIYSTPKLPKIELERIQLSNVEPDINNALNNFTDIMYNTFFDEDLAFMYRNIKNLSIQNGYDASLLSDSNDSTIQGVYNIVNNKITVFKINNFVVFYHELLHMASSYYLVEGDKIDVVYPFNGKEINKSIDLRQERVYSGFSQSVKYMGKKERGVFGFGLNEGYTEVLSSRYFHQFVKETIQPAYQYEKFAARVIERIVGQENMEKYYFGGDLTSLVNSLLPYVDSMSEILYLLKNLDFYTKYKNYFYLDKNLNKKNIYNFSEVFNFIGIMLYKMYIRKLIKENEDLDIDELKKVLDDNSDQFTSFCIAVVKSNEYYHILTVKQKDEYINKEIKKIKELQK